MPTVPNPFSFNRQDLTLIMPQLQLVLFGLGILLIDFWVDAKTKYMNAVLALLGTVFSGFALSRLYIQLSVRAEMGEQVAGLAGFKDTIYLDPFAVFFSALFLAATALVVLLSVKYLEIEEEHHGEYYALMLFACAGMMFMASGNDLVVLFLGLETMAISFYVLTGFLRRERRSNEAAVKYMLLGAFSSGILAYGFSLLYGIGASTNIQAIGSRLAERMRLMDVLKMGQLSGVQGEQIRHSLEAQLPGIWQQDPFLWQVLPVLAFVTVAAGLFFKVAAAPFHQWAPDVYEGAPTPIAAYVSVASKAASFALMVRIFVAVFGSTHAQWFYVVAAVAVVSLTWGNLAAITQTNVKRLLAYSSIAHSGYILLGLAAGSAVGLQGLAYYLMVYLFMTAGAFALVIVLRRKGLIGDELEDLNGLYQRSPAAAVLLLIFMMSLAGIPPTAGFMAKYYILQALINTQHPALAVIAALYIVPALYYYFRVVVHAWMKAPGDAPRPVMSLGQTVAVTVAVFVTLAAGVYPEPFAQLARFAFSIGR
jgi:NADH-quinone oxidoreductase subunit N